MLSDTVHTDADKFQPLHQVVNYDWGGHINDWISK